MRNKIQRFCLSALIILNVFLFTSKSIFAENQTAEVRIPVEQFSENKTVHSYTLQPLDKNCSSFTWSMKGNDTYELVIPVTKEGTYQYYVKSDLKTGSYEISITGLVNDKSSLDTVTVVRNSTGEKVSDITFDYSSDMQKTEKHSSVYTGDESSIAGYASVFVLSLSVLFGLVLNRKGEE